MFSEQFQAKILKYVKEATFLVIECHAKSERSYGQFFGHIIHIFKDTELKFAENVQVLNKLGFVEKY